MFSTSELNYVMRIKPPNCVVNWHKHHLEICHVNKFDAYNLQNFEGYADYLANFAQSGLAFSGLHEGEIYTMFGVWQLWPGVAEAWLIPSRHIGRATVPFHRGALRFFSHAARKMNVKRLQFTVHSLNVPACTWAERCYFEREGTMRNYGPDGADYHMYSRMF